MNLDDAQRATVQRWIREGLQLAEIQTRLAQELGISLTYMEVRFLLDDLQLQPKDKERPATLVAPPGKGAPLDAGTGSRAPAEPEPTGGVSITVDQVTRPGAVVSGRVTFSDGNSAEWYLDQMGRLGMAPQRQGYRPSQEDLLAFQAELQEALARYGY